MLLPDDNDGVGDDTNDDRGYAVEHVRGKTYNRPKPATSSVLRQIDARPDPDRDTQQAGDP